MIVGRLAVLIVVMGELVNRHVHDVIQDYTPAGAPLYYPHNNYPYNNNPHNNDPQMR